MRVIDRVAAYVEAGLSAEQLRDPDVLHRVRLTAFIAVTAGALTLLLVPSAMIAAVAPASGAAVAGCLVSAGLHLIAPLVLRATRSLAVTAHLFAGHVFAGLALSTLLAGGLRSPTLVAAPVVVPLAMLIGGLVAKERRLVRNDVASRTIDVAPVPMGRGGVGLGVWGTM